MKLFIVTLNFTYVHVISQINIQAIPLEFVSQSTVSHHKHRKWHPPLSNTKSRLHIFTAFLSNLEVFQPRIRCPYHFLEIPGCRTKVTNLARMSAHVSTLYTGWHWPAGDEVVTSTCSMQPCKYGNRRQARFDLKIVPCSLVIETCAWPARLARLGAGHGRVDRKQVENVFLNGTEHCAKLIFKTIQDWKSFY